MSPDPRTTPLHVRSPYRALVTEIDWADGHYSVYPHEILRGYCPCAGCQGHSADIRFVPGGATLIKEISVVGDYAFQLEWDDGHGSGLYSFRYLRGLCQCTECVPVDRAGERPLRARA